MAFDLKAFISVVFIDLVMSGDNAIVIGLAVAGLPRDIRKKAIFYGIVAATVLRILFSSITYELLGILGLTLAGGLLLLWVAYKMWQEIKSQKPKDDDSGITAGKTLFQAMRTIIIADVSMSLDNVLAVAGAAYGSPGMLVFGLLLSIVLMAVAANYLATLLEKHKWLTYIGLLVVAYVALEMIWRGSQEVLAAAV